MAKIRVTNTTQVTHNAVQIEGLREVSFDIDVVEKTFGSDGEPTETDAVDFTVAGQATFEDVQAYNTALGNAESNLVVTGRTEGGGTDRIITAKNCVFSGTAITLPTRQDRGIGTYRCKLRCNPGSADTPSTMITEAAAP
ncbi:MAG: hypothetical protein KAV82_15180 [Phycisphaerae bacterium]|nr:hypothetical protein [Phycisphaerae bacterium]